MSGHRTRHIARVLSPSTRPSPRHTGSESHRATAAGSDRLGTRPRSQTGSRTRPQSADNRPCAGNATNRGHFSQGDSPNSRYSRSSRLAIGARLARLGATPDFHHGLLNVTARGSFLCDQVVDAVDASALHDALDVSRIADVEERIARSEE